VTNGEDVKWCECENLYAELDRING